MNTLSFLSKPGWNSDPRHDPRPDICKAKKAFAADESFTVTWTCADIERIQKNERAYFRRVGKEPRGFFARGIVIAAINPLNSTAKFSYLNEAYSKIIDSQFAVDIEWIEVVDYDQPLKNSELEDKPEFQGLMKYINNQKSGTIINKKIVGLLDREWEKHLTKLI